MKKFKFRFQSILDLHEKELEKAELEVAAAHKKLLDAQNVLQSYKEEVSNRKESLKKVMSAGRVDVTTLGQYQNYLTHLKGRITSQHSEIKICESSLDEVRQQMLLIRQKKMMMEKLKDKEYKNFLKELEYADNKNIDEIATVRHLRNKR